MALRGVAPFIIPPPLFVERLSGARKRREPCRVATPTTSPLKPSLSSASNCTVSSASDYDAQSEPAQDQDEEVALGFSFSGGGWLMCYMFGVAEALREAGIHHEARFIGTSAGALTAFGLTMDVNFEAICNGPLEEYVAEARGTWTGAFRMREYLLDVLHHHTNLHNYEQYCQDPRKFTVVYTSLSAWEPRRKSTFKTCEHLVNTLLASCCATPVAGLPFKLLDEWVIDGGIMENQPEFDASHGVQRTVKVTPNFYDTSADIRPSQYIPPWWSMYPPSHDELLWVFRLGQHDGLDWCAREGFMPPRAVMPTHDTRVCPSSLQPSTVSIQELAFSRKSHDPVMMLWSFMALIAAVSVLADSESIGSMKIAAVCLLSALHAVLSGRESPDLVG